MRAAPLVGLLLLAAGLGGCTRPQPAVPRSTELSLETFRTDPLEAPMGEATLSALLQRQGTRWEVTIILSRSPAPTPIDGAEVEAELLDAAGQPLPLERRPEGPLVEAGGSLAMSANAPFEFRDAGAPPVTLIVRWRGQSARLRVVPAPTGP